MTLQVADLLEAVAAAVPDRLAISCDGHRLTYAELDQRANKLAAYLVAAGLQPGEHVGLHMLNGVEFVESLMGCMKARLVPINVNYRYTEHELRYLYQDAELAGLVVGTDFAPAGAAVAADCPKLRSVLVVGGADAEGASWPATVSVEHYEQCLSAQPGNVAPRAGTRSPDDHYVLYTGGTTGKPKGVVWRHEDFFFAALSGGNPYGEPFRDESSMAAAAVEHTPMHTLITVPLMHGAAVYSLFTSMLKGNYITIMRRFQPMDALRLIQDEKINTVTIVGDAIARPLADALAEHRSEFDLSSWFYLGSGGAIFSKAVRADIAALMPDLMLGDNFGASESGVDGQMSLGDDGLMRMSPNPSVTVIDDRFQSVAPGSDDIGFVARTGHVPVAYHNDPEKTAKTFPVIDGVRWSVLGDMARIETDGTIVVLGRGSGCINTGGEKVFPEEVEQALKSHPAVLDVLVAGIPDDMFGQRVAAAIELRPDVPAPAAEELRQHCRTELAGYKVPATIRFVDTVVRSPSGKADYRWAKSELTGEPADA